MVERCFCTADARSSTLLISIKTNKFFPSLKKSDGATPETKRIGCRVPIRAQIRALHGQAPFGGLTVQGTLAALSAFAKKNGMESYKINISFVWRPSRRDPDGPESWPPDLGQPLGAEKDLGALPLKEAVGFCPFQLNFG